MAKANKCQQCGSKLPFNAPQGLCPRCLMSMGLSLKERGSVEADPPLASDHFEENVGAEPKKCKRPQNRGTGTGPS